MNKPVHKAERLTIALERPPLQFLHMQRFRQLYYISILAIKNLASINNNITASLINKKGCLSYLAVFRKEQQQRHQRKSTTMYTRWTIVYRRRTMFFRKLGTTNFTMTLWINLYVSASVSLTKLWRLFTSATINKNVTINFGKEWTVVIGKCFRQFILVFTFLQTWIYLMK